MNPTSVSVFVESHENKVSILYPSNVINFRYTSFKIPIFRNLENKKALSHHTWHLKSMTILIWRTLFLCKNITTGTSGAPGLVTNFLCCICDKLGATTARQFCIYLTYEMKTGLLKIIKSIPCCLHVNVKEKVIHFAENGYYISDRRVTVFALILRAVLLRVFALAAGSLHITINNCSDLRVQTRIHLAFFEILH